MGWQVAVPFKEMSGTYAGLVSYRSYLLADFLCSSGNGMIAKAAIECAQYMLFWNKRRDTLTLFADLACCGSCTCPNQTCAKQTTPKRRNDSHILENRLCDFGPVFDDQRRTSLNFVFNKRSRSIEALCKAIDGSQDGVLDGFFLWPSNKELA